MRIFSKLLIVIGLLIFQVGPVFAQGTILPAPSDRADCVQVLNDYEELGKMPSQKDFENAKNIDSNKASNQKDFEEKQNKFKEASEKNNEAITKSQDAKSNLEQSENALQQAKSQYDSLVAWCANSDPLACDKISEAKSNYDKSGEDHTGAFNNVLESQNNLQASESEKMNASQEYDKIAASTEYSNAAERVISLRDNLLGCAIKTGRISFSMIPYFITYIVNFALGLVGLISVLFIVLGGYFYVFGGLTEDKDKGKKTIVHALEGMALALMAWTIVNVIIGAVTG